MIRIANLLIDTDALELLPESLARSLTVLPLGIKDGKLRVVFGRQDDYGDAIDMLEFVLNRKLVCFVADFDRVRKAIDEVYLLSATEVENCPLDFREPCPKKWLELRPTQDARVRFCEACHRNVVFCQNENEAVEETAAGQCVAVYRFVENECCESAGLIEFTE